MNKNIKSLYIQFHTKRRLFIEEETEKRYQEMIADDWSESPSTRMEALYVVMGKRNEQMDFEEFSNLIIEDCISEVLQYNCNTIVHDHIPENMTTEQLEEKAYIKGVACGYNDAVKQIADGLKDYCGIE